MKSIVAFVFCLLFSVLGCATVIQSTTAGGFWSDEQTWELGIVPGPDDDVVIRGYVTLISNPTCHNLSLQGASAFLGNHANSNNVITITGNLVCNGWLGSNDSNGCYLTVNLYGNLYNSYRITPHYLNILGNGNRNFEAAQIPETGEWCALDIATAVTVAAGIDTIFLNSPMVYKGGVSSNCLFNGDGYPFKMLLASGTGRTIPSIKFENCNLRNVEIVGTNVNNFNWISTRNTDIENCVLNGLTIQSNGSIWVKNNVSLIDIINNTNIYNRQNNDYSIILGGTIVNNGSIRNNPNGYNLDMVCSATILNYGTFKPRNLSLTGSSEIGILCSADHPFEASGEVNMNASVPGIRALSDLLLFFDDLA